jgi:hypothetical protein
VAHNRGNGNADRAEPSAADLRRWRQHLANERAEACVYRDLAQRRTGAETSCWRWPPPRDATSSTGWPCLKGTSASRAAATSARRFDEGDPYFTALSDEWGEGVRQHSGGGQWACRSGKRFE